MKLFLILFGFITLASAAELIVTSINFAQDSINLNIGEGTPKPQTSVQQINGNDPITIMFNQAVVPLGANYGNEQDVSSWPFTMNCTVPGKFRWATTYLARFDPDIDWPSDLTCTVSVPKTLTTFAGASLSNPVSRTFTTRQQRITGMSVSSQIALEKTGGRWTATSVNYNLPEVPPDAKIKVNFLYPVEVSLVQNSLKAFDSAQKGAANKDYLAFTLSACEGNDRCVTLVFNNPLTPLHNYTLEMSAGSTYHSLSGPFADDHRWQFSSLVPFTIPFHESKSLQHVRYRRYDMWLMHGLADGVTADDFKNVISLDPPLPFTLSTPNEATLRLAADFMPNTEYTISVAGSSTIKDGFGFALQPSSTSFKTSKLNWRCVEARGDGVMPLTFSAEWELLCVGDGGSQSTRLTNVNVNNLESALVHMRSYSRSLWVDPTNSPSVTIKASSTSDPKSFSSAMESTFGESQLILRESTDQYGNIQKYLVSRSDISTAFIAREGSIFAWVTRTAVDAAPQNVTGATVTYYSVTNNAASKVDTATTGADGIAELDISLTSGSRYVVVNVGGALSLFNNIYGYSGASPYTQVLNTMITDRAVYKPGDTVYLKGYVVTQTNQGVVASPPANTRFTIQAEWARDNDYNVISRTDLPVTVDPTYASFNASFQIPLDAEYRSVQIGLSTGIGFGDCRIGSNYGYCSTDILIAEPRPPTVELELSSPAKFIPVASTEVPVAVVASSLTGLPVSGARITLEWTVSLSSPNYYTASPYPMVSSPYGGGVMYGGGGMRSDMAYPPSGPSVSSGNAVARGTEVVVTDNDGKVDMSIVLNGLDTPLNCSHSVSVKATWFAPTRETLESTVSLDVDYFELQLNVRPTIDDVLPGYDFGVQIDVTNRDGTPKTGQRVEVWMAAVGDATTITRDASGAYQLPDNAVKRCEIASLSNGPTACKLNMATVDRFAIVASAYDGANMVATGLTFVGKTQAQWAKSPVMNLAGISASLDKSEYRPGDTVSVSFDNPFNGGALLITHGTQHVFYTLKKGPQTLAVSGLTAGSSSCVQQCSVVVAFVFSGQSSALTFPVEVPVHPEFDTTLPRFFGNSLSVKVQDPVKALKVAITTALPGDVARPNTTVPITVKVTDESGTPIESAQVAVFAVAKSMLELRPHPLVQLAGRYDVTIPQSMTFAGQSVNMASASQYSYLASTFLRRAKLDPWTLDVMNWPLASFSHLPVADSDFFSSLVSALTSLPSIQSNYKGKSGAVPPGSGMDDMEYMQADFGGGAAAGGGAMPTAMPAYGMPESAPAPPQAMDGADRNGGAPEDASAGGGGSVTSKSALRTNFVTTPLFAPRLVTDASGEATVNVNLPDNADTFVLRAYVVSSTKIMGQAENEFAVRKPLTLQPSVPQKVRVGDRFECGVSVQSETDAPAVAIAVVSDAAKTPLQGSAANTVALNANEIQESVFSFRATALGEATMNFTAEAGSSSDALMAKIPVLGQQDPVYVATSFAIQGSATGVWDESVKLPDAVPGSGSLDVLAGVGRLAAILGNSAQLLDLPEEYEPGATDLLGALVPTAALNGYSSAQNSATAQLARYVSKDAAGQLPMYTDQDLGLLYRPVNSYHNYRPTTDISLQSFAIYITSRVNQMANTDVANALVPTWKAALGREMVRVYQRSIQFGGVFRSWSSLALAYIGLGVDYNFNIPDLHLSRLLETDQLNVLPSSRQAQLAIAFLRFPNRNATHVDWAAKILAALLTRLRVATRTAYIDGEAFDLEANAYVLSAMSLAYVNNPLVEKLANYVALGGPTSSSYNYYMSARSGAVSSIALADYDAARNSQNPNLALAVKNGVTQLLAHQFTPNSAATANTTTSWATLDAGERITFSAEGTGEVSVNLGMTFTPATISLTPIYRGIDVAKKICKFDKTTQQFSEEPVYSANAGDLLQVTVQITTADSLENVQIVDLLPGGLEPVDDSSSNGPTPCAYCALPTGRYGGGFWSVFSDKRVQKERVTWTGAYVYSGTHSVTYQVRATTSGSFRLPPAKAYMIDSPEMMGLSRGGSFFVSRNLDNESPEVRIINVGSYRKTVQLYGTQEMKNEQLMSHESLLVVPQQCPNDCSGQGTCDQEKGSCSCDVGFSGDDCHFADGSSMSTSAFSASDIAQFITLAEPITPSPAPNSPPLTISAGVSSITVSFVLFLFSLALLLLN